MDRLERALRETARAGTTGALMHVHLERFEQIIEAFGLGIGDSLLKGVAMRLDLGLRSSVAARRAAASAAGCRRSTASATTSSRSS